MTTARRDRAQTLLKAVNDIARYDMDHWGTGGIGVALMQLHFEDEWTTVKKLALDTALGEAQVRRRLALLVSQGRVAECRPDSGPHLYRIVHHHAENYISELCHIFPLQFANGVDDVKTIS